MTSTKNRVSTDGRRRHRIYGLIAAIAVIATAVAILRPTPDREIPFPMIGVVDDGDPVEHVVTRWQRQGRVTVVDPASWSAEPEIWRGALRWNGQTGPTVTEWLDGSDFEGVFSRRIVTTDSLHVGHEITGWSLGAYLFDFEMDGAIDLAIFRQPGEGRSPLDALAFLAADHDEMAVATRGRAEMLVHRYMTYGLSAIACDGIGVAVGTEAGSDDLVLDCRPSTPEPIVDPTETDAHEAELDGTSPLASYLRPGADRGTIQDSRELPAALSCEEEQLAVKEAERLLAAAEREIARRKERLAERERVFDTVRDAVGTSFDLSELEKTFPADISDAEAAARLKRVVSGKVTDAVRKEMINGWNPDRADLAEIQNMLYELGAALRAGTHAGLIKSIADWHLWSAEQARKAADAIANEEYTALQRARNQLADARNALHDCLNRGGLPNSEQQIASSKGEPHITTFDGLSYGFQGVGEYVLARADGFEVQARYGPIRDGIASVAVAVGLILPGASEPVSVYAEGQPRDGWVIFLGNERYDVADGSSRLGDYVIEAAAGSLVRVTVDSTVTVEARALTTQRDLFNIVTVAFDNGAIGDLAGGIYGNADGDPTNDLTSASGERIDVRVPSRHDLYDVFGESWRVKDVGESLFVYDDGLGPDSFHNPRFPAADAPTLSTFSRAELDAAIAACHEAGVWVEPSLSECIFDVTIMDNPAWVEGGLQSQGQLPVHDLRPLALPGALLAEPGIYILWEAEATTVIGLVAGVAGRSGSSLQIRGPRIVTESSDQLIWPGWGDVPSRVTTDVGTLSITLSGDHGLIVALDPADGTVSGLATAGSAGPETDLIDPAAVATGRTDWELNR